MNTKNLTENPRVSSVVHLEESHRIIEPPQNQKSRKYANIMSAATCTKCGKQAKYSCERCLEPFCSSECQLGDWERHKDICYKFPNLKTMTISKTCSPLTTTNVLWKDAGVVSLVQSDKGLRSIQSPYDAACLKYGSFECQSNWGENKETCYKYPVRSNLIPMDISETCSQSTTKNVMLPEDSGEGSAVQLDESHRSIEPSYDASCTKCDQPPTFKCERCLACSECQLDDWRQHKEICCNQKSYNQKSHNPIEYIEDVGVIQISAAVKPKNDIVPLPPTQNPRTNSKICISRLPDPDKCFNWRTPYAPPSDFFDAIVQFEEELQNSQRYIWVTNAKYDKPLQNLLLEINRNIKKTDSCKPDLIVPGALVAATLDKIIYRAKVINTSPDDRTADVRLIDYGNEVRVTYSQICPPIPIMVNLNAYALRVCIPNDCGPFDLHSIITIRVVGEKTSEDYYNVECKGTTIPLQLDVESIIKEESLTVAKCFADGRSALLRLSNFKECDMDQVLNSAQTIRYEFEKIPVEGTFVAALIGHSWKRARFLAYYEKELQFLVYTIDEGFIALSREIKRIPKPFISRSIRVFAITISSSDYILSETMLSSAKNLSLQLLPTSSAPAEKNTKTHITCALFDNNHKIFDVVIASVFTGQLDELGLKFWHDYIAEGSSVFVSHAISYKEIYIASSDTKNYPALIMSEYQNCTCFASSDISKGDMVIVSSPTDVIYRGEIIGCENNSFKLRNIDSGSEDVVKRKHLLKPSQLLRSLPVLCSQAKLMRLESTLTPTTNNKALAALKSCVKNKTEFYVTYAAGSKQTIDLLFHTEHRQSACEKLLPMVLEPCNDSEYKQVETNLPVTPLDTSREYKTSVAAQPDVAGKQGPFTIDDLQVIPIAAGENSSLYVLDATTLLNHDYPYVTAADYDNKQFLAKMEKNLSRVGTYCTGPTAPTKGYAPIKMEICLSVFGEDGEWYRALCLNHCPNETFEVMFLDYGNVAKLGKKDIKPITPDLMFPSNANMIFVEGISTEKQALKLVKAIQKNPIISAEVKRVEESDVYVAKIHQIEQLID